MRLTIKHILSIVILLLPVGLFAQSSSDIQAYIAQYSKIAVQQERQYGVPAAITLAQGILESGAGRSKLTRNANNHFGVKAYGGWTGPIYLAWDDETKKSSFRKYASAADSFRDHSTFLRNNSRYRSLFAKSIYDYRGWAIGLQKAGYATATTYAKALIGLIDAYRLYAFNGGVKLRAGRTVVIKHTSSSSSTPQFDSSCIMNDDEVSDEEIDVTNAISRFVVEINNVRCTTLYPGETLASISMKYDIPQSKLLAYNETSSAAGFKEGDVIYLESKKNEFTGIQDYYKVKKDDTLYSISQQFGIKVSSLAKINSKTLFDRLSEGEKLYIKK